MDALLFAATKIQPPRPRVKQLPRPALLARVQAAVGSHRLVMLQAPAGYGKTSLLSALLAALPAASARACISLDADDDAPRLFACLAAALEPADLPWRQAPEALVALAGGDASARQRAVAGLVNALADAEVPQGTIVLDDLHRTADAGLAALLEALVERLPPRWTLVIGTRTEAPLPLGRWRAAGELAEFDRADLAFTPEEAQALLAAEGATGERAAELAQRSAGWPAALRLAAMGTRRAHPGLAERHLFDYMAAEVLDELPAPLHEFLLRCSVLPELTAGRCAAVSGDALAAAWLEDIERRGLFATALDAQERTLVLHDLLRDALSARLKERLPHEVPALLRRAAAGETDPLRRVGYLLRAEDWPAAESALAGAAEALFLAGAAREVERGVAQFPAERHSARLHRLGAIAACLRWDWTAMGRGCETAAAAARAAGDDTELQRAQALLASALYALDRNAEAEALIATLSGLALPPEARAQVLLADCLQHFRRGEHARLPALFGEVLALLEGGLPLYRWWELAPPRNWSTIDGMAALVDRYLAGALARIGERPLPMRAQLLALRAWAHLWAARFDAADADITAAEADARWLAVSGETELSIEQFHLVRDVMHGRADTVQQRMQAQLQREQDAPPERRALYWHHVAVVAVRLSDGLGDAEGLQRWAGLMRENPLEDDRSQLPRAVAARARWAAAQGRWADAADLFTALLPHLPSMDVMAQRTDLALRAAHALLRAGRAADAAVPLGEVLARIQREGLRGQAMVTHPAVLQTLADARWGTLLGAPAQAELQALASLSAQLRGTLAAAAPAADGPLSSREREVLERLAAGDSNKLIARALDISPHTVKRHVANILDKLGLASRGQAAAWLRQHP